MACNNIDRGNMTLHVATTTCFTCPDVSTDIIEVLTTVSFARFLVATQIVCAATVRQEHMNWVAPQLCTVLTYRYVTYRTVASLWSRLTTADGVKCLAVTTSIYCVATYSLLTYHYVATKFFKLPLSSIFVKCS